MTPWKQWLHEVTCGGLSPSLLTLFSEVDCDPETSTYSVKGWRVNIFDFVIHNSVSAQLFNFAIVDISSQKQYINKNVGMFQ